MYTATAVDGTWGERSKTGVVDSQSLEALGYFASSASCSLGGKVLRNLLSRKPTIIGTESMIAKKSCREPFRMLPSFLVSTFALPDLFRRPMMTAQE